MHFNLDKEHSKVILVGPPNAGKTTLFNWLTGSRFKTVNYPGATVELHYGKSLSRYGEICQVVDSPGIRTLEPLSPDEQVTLDLISTVAQGPQRFAIILPVDASQLERHLILIKQLQELGAPMLIALTMGDLLKSKHLKVNSQVLSQILQVPVVEVDGRLGGGVQEVLQTALKIAQKPQADATSVAAKLKNRQAWSEAQLQAAFEDIEAQLPRVLESLTALPDASAQVLPQKMRQADPHTLKVDHFLMHPLLGLLVFFGVMTALFSSIFYVADPLMGFVDESFAAIAESVLGLFAEGSLVGDFLANGLILGFGAVAVFVPQILILFVGVSLLEDSGYLARAATMVDRVLSTIGLSGRSFVPLLSGFACAVPAMMAARTINSRKERLLTLFVIPLMSCSARLPVYALLLGFLFKPEDSLLAGISLAVLYLLSIVMGSVVAAFVSRFIKAKDNSFLLLELPAYRWPKPAVILRTAFDRTKSYVVRAGGTIVVVSLVIWTLTNFPNYAEQDATVKLETSYAATVGQVLEPIVAPMGIDWRVGVGLISAFAAREVFVSTLAVIFHVSDQEDEESLKQSLIQQMRNASFPDGRPIFTVASVVGLLIYFVIALQCITTTVVAAKEAGVKYFASIQVMSFNLLAYVTTVIVVQILQSFGY